MNAIFTKDTPTFAIITRTLGRNLLLERTVQSVKNQTYRNFELVIINDGGNQKEIDQLVLNTGLKEQISVIHNVKTIGRWRSANKAIKQSKSKYIVLLDDDDTWDVKFLEIVHKIIEESGCWAVAVSSDKISEKIENGAIEKLADQPFFVYRTPIQAYDLFEQNLLPTNAFVYARECYNELGGYDETMPVLADWEFNIRFISKYDVVTIPDILAHIHHRPENDTGLNGNTVIAGVGEHNKTRVELLNKKLRKDLSNQVVGEGILLNQQDALRKKFLQWGETYSKQFSSLNAKIDQQQIQITEMMRMINEQNRKLEDTMARKVQKIIQKIKSK